MKKVILIFLLIISITSQSIIDETIENFTLKSNQIFGEKIIVSLIDSTRIIGNVFIFDKIEKEEYLEEYKDKVIEIVSHLKETSQFSYADLNFFIVDERVLWADNINEASYRLKDAKNNLKKVEDFLDYREKVLSNLESAVTQEGVIEKIQNLERSDIHSYYNNDFISYSMLYHTSIYSPRAWRDTPYLRYHNMANFDKREDIKFYNTMKVLFESEEDEAKKVPDYINEWRRVHSDEL